VFPFFGLLNRAARLPPPRFIARSRKQSNSIPEPGTACEKPRPERNVRHADGVYLLLLRHAGTFGCLALRHFKSIPKATFEIF
jgi:hypothetical protein